MALKMIFFLALPVLLHQKMGFVYTRSPIPFNSMTNINSILRYQCFLEHILGNAIFEEKVEIM